MTECRSLVYQAQLFIAKALHSGGIAVDATMGNGHDTLFLAQQVTDNGHVYAFDIQTQAIDITRQRLESTQWLPRVSLIHGNHADLHIHLSSVCVSSIHAAMFNLGYLPRGDKTVTTCIDSTLLALKSSLDLTAPGGRVSVVAYTGHPGGLEETMAVAHFLTTLNHQTYVIQRESGQSKTRVASKSAPQLFMITRI